MDNIKSETCPLSAGTKVLKEYSTKFYKKIWPLEKLSYFNASFDECLVNISYNNRVGSNIETSISELEAKIETELAKITADNAKTTKYFNMKLSVITSKKPSLSYEQPSSDLIKCPLLKPP